MNKIERIHQIIKIEKLFEKSKKQNKVHRRYFIYDYLRKNEYRLREIAELFNVDHSTIIYGINQVNLFEQTKDEMFYIDTLDLFQEFNGVKIKQRSRSLINDIMASTHLNDLTKIQRRLLNNGYKFYDKNELN